MKKFQLIWNLVLLNFDIGIFSAFSSIEILVLNTFLNFVIYSLFSLSPEFFTTVLRSTDQTSIVGNFYFRKESISNRFCVKTQSSWTILDFLQVVLLSIGFLVLHAFRLQQFSLQQLRESFCWLYQNKWKVFMTFNEFIRCFH